MTTNIPSGKTRLVTITGQQRPEKEIIEDLRGRLDCLLNEGAITQTVQVVIDSIKIQLENCGLSREEISEIGIH